MDLNFYESAALTYAHVKRCKLRNEADIVVPQSSTDWSTRSATGATSLVKEHDQYNSCWMYSTTEGIESAVFKAQGKMVEISTQQIISCDTTDDDCIGGDLITVFNYVQGTPVGPGKDTHDTLGNDQREGRGWPEHSSAQCRNTANKIEKGKKKDETKKEKNN